MSACGSRLSLNRRIDPAVAVKASVRPGSTSVCLVVESGGRRCCSEAAGEFAAALPCSPVAPDFCAEGVAAGWGGCGASSARAMAIMKSARSAKTKEARLRLKRRQPGVIGNRRATAMILDDVDIALAPGGGGLMVQRRYRR